MARRRPRQQRRYAPLPLSYDIPLTSPGATFDLEFVAGNLSLRDCFNKAYDVNVTGAHVTSWTFMPLLLTSADPRLLFVAGLSYMTAAKRGPVLPDAGSTGRLAQADRLRDHRIPL